MGATEPLISEFTRASQSDEPRFDEREERERGFSAYFDREIKPLMIAWEVERSALARKTRLVALTGRIVGGGLIAAVIAMFFAFPFHPSLGRLMVPLFLLSAPFLALGMNVYNIFVEPEYGEGVRQVLIPKILGFFGDFKYARRGCLNIADLMGSSQITGYDLGESRCGGLVTGTYRGEMVSWCELFVFFRGDKSVRVIFNGLLLQFALDRPLSGRTVVFSEKDIGAIANFRLNGLQHISLESGDFERTYAVYGSSQTEARYLLPPDVMEELLRLQGVFGGGPLRCLYAGNSAYVAVPLKAPLFYRRASLRAPLAIDDIRDCLRQISDVITIVQTLDIERK